MSRTWTVWRPDIETRESACRIEAASAKDAAELGYYEKAASDAWFADHLVCVVSGKGAYSYWNVHMTMEGGVAKRTQRAGQS